MTELLGWEQVVNDDTEYLEFGACHVNAAWRTHKTDQNRFLGLQSAFVTSSHRLPRLLQSVESNSNARNNPQRGQALFAAVWSNRYSWAILCDATHAVLVSKSTVASLKDDKTRNDGIVAQLRELMETTPDTLRTVFDETFYNRMIRQNH